MTSRRTLLIGALVVFAQYGQALAVTTEAPPGPAAPIEALNDGLLRVMQAGRATPFAKRLAMLTPIVQQAFDLTAILKSSVGPLRWTALPEPQRSTLLDVFTEFTVGSYVANFDAYNGEKFVVAPDQRHVGSDIVVQTRILGPAGETTKLDYVMREGTAGWQAVDVLLDGSISRVAVTRSDFRNLVASNDAAPLIASLKDKVSMMAANAAP